MKMKKKFLHVILLLTVVLAMTATTAFASADGASSLFKSKRTPVATTEVSSTDTSTTVTPAPHGNSDHARNQNKGNGVGNQTKAKKLNFRGVVAASDAASLTVTLKDGSTMVFALDANTVIKYPAHFVPVVTAVPSETATVAPSETSTATVAPEGPLPVGAQVSVKAALQQDGTYLALSVMVIPGKPVKVHHVGVITAYEAGVSIEITASDGTVATFELSPTTKYLPDGSETTLKVGDTVTIIMPRVIAGQPWVAMGVVLHGADGTEVGSTDEAAEPTEVAETPEASDTPEVSETPEASDTPEVTETVVIPTESTTPPASDTTGQ